MPTSPPLSTPSNQPTQPNFNSNLSFISITTSNRQNVTYNSLPPLTNPTRNPKSENENLPDAHFTPPFYTKQPTHTTKFQLKSIIHIHHDLKPPKYHLQLTTTTH